MLWRVNVIVTHAVVEALSIVKKNFRGVFSKEKCPQERNSYRKQHSLELQGFCEKLLRPEATGGTLSPTEYLK